MKLALSAGALALSMALAGCGGGGSSTQNAPRGANDTQLPPAENDTETTVMAAPVTLPTDGDSYLDSMVTLADTTAPVRLVTDGTHTAGHFTFTCDTGPCVITIEDGEVSATGTVSAAYSAAAQDTINDAKMVAMAEKKARVDGLFNALTDDPQSGQEIFGSAPISVSRGLSGDATVTLGPFGGRAGWKAGDAPSTSVTGMAGHTLEQKTRRYVVYTDIAAAKRKSWGDVYVDKAGDFGVAEAGEVSSLLGISEVTFPDTDGADTNEGTEDDLPLGTIQLTAAAMQRAARAGLLDMANFPKPGDPNSATVTYTYNNGQDDDDKEAVFKGTFHGASGEYACIATTPACQVSVTASTSGNHPIYTVAADSGSWQFRPDNKNNPQIVEQDSDHMHFGWWIDTPVKDDGTGVFQYDVQVFSGGSDHFDNAGALNALTGTVSYEGPAAGLYAVKAHKDADDMDVPAAHGEFTATAELTANFDTNSVSGTVKSFVRNDGVDNEWSLTLNGAAILTTTGNIGSNGTTPGRIVAGSEAIGEWNYQLHGSHTKNRSPSGISGEFNAAINSNTAVAGGFAAK